MIDTQTAIIGVLVAGAATLNQLTAHFRDKRRELQVHKESNEIKDHTKEVKEKLEVISVNVDGRLSAALQEIQELKNTVSGLNKVVEKLLGRNGGKLK